MIIFRCETAMQQIFRRNFAFFFCFCGSILFTINNVFCSVSCPTGWIPLHDTQKCIKFFDDQRSFHDSSSTCWLKDKARLFGIQSCKSNYIIAEELKRRNLTYWFGLSQNKIRGVFRWHTTTIDLPNFKDTSFFNWYHLNPNISERSCGVINSPGIPKGYWVDDPCDNEHGRICAKTPERICNGEMYGLTCTRPCSKNCAGPKKRCSPVNGKCLHGCSSGYRGPLCDKHCANRTYGLNCKHTCSSHCHMYFHECDPVTGRCIDGCQDGFLPPTCHKPCHRGTYGQNCHLNCSEHCAGRLKLCNSGNGDCTSGCVLGYSGSLCILPTHEPFIDVNLLKVTAICAVSTLVSVLLAVFVFWPNLIVSEDEEGNDGGNTRDDGGIIRDDREYDRGYGYDDRGDVSSIWDDRGDESSIWDDRGDDRIDNRIDDRSEMDYESTYVE